MIIFGVLAVTAGVMILWLPETLNSNMCQTFEETNQAKEYYGFIWMEKRVKNPFSFSRWDSCNIFKAFVLFVSSIVTQLKRCFGITVRSTVKPVHFIISNIVTN